MTIFYVLPLLCLSDFQLPTSFPFRLEHFLVLEVVKKVYGVLEEKTCRLAGTRTRKTEENFGREKKKIWQTWHEAVRKKNHSQGNKRILKTSCFILWLLLIYYARVSQKYSGNSVSASNKTSKDEKCSKVWTLKWILMKI